jgi:four helix bundle protein
MSHVDSFLDLKVYQEACSVSQRIFALTKQFPEEEKFALTSQIRRSCRSIGAQIAEAWAKRRYQKHFVSKLTDADGEQRETQHWVATAHSDGYLDGETAHAIIGSLEEIGRMLQGMIDKAHLFCHPRLEPESLD